MGYNGNAYGQSLGREGGSSIEQKEDRRHQRPRSMVRSTAVRLADPNNCQMTACIPQ